MQTETDEAAMTTREVLIAARALIEDERNWTQETYARDATGKPVLSGSYAACQWCASGAVMNVADYPWSSGPFDTLDAAAIQFGVANAEDFNDTLGHAKVMEMFDLAIETEEQR